MAHLARPRVLIVDDHPQMRARIAASLAQSCDIVASAADGLSALAAAAAVNPDVIVLDVSMPGMSGLDVAARLRQAGSTVQIVFYTACDDEDVRNASELVGPSGFVLKPQVRQLVSAVIGKAPV